MQISELKEKIKNLPNDQEVIFYNLENYNLTEYDLESIIDVDGRLEITTTKEGRWKKCRSIKSW